MMSSYNTTQVETSSSQPVFGGAQPLRLVTTGLNYLTKVVKTSFTSNSYNSKMLLTHCFININNVIYYITHKYFYF